MMTCEYLNSLLLFITYAYFRYLQHYERSKIFLNNEYHKIKARADSVAVFTFIDDAGACRGS